ncbi:ABC transporter substrate-binding protein [Fructobacillus sp. M1-13]|uniref:ABC transporter substrate-binding protein n=1 Tax=Fructobacillus papyriferae TaxID=2713171 RepID=A0ABS5QQS0_9LACO|nr:ABC transporter substrate-binding protein [Fructobacillus papyriferae]MBS9335529.1 ABC transporter substrate-binding protein [Fructobacillus papyriferae]MCD2159381.1 ABC transporter substrate-binding protein [Fructobacillus papyriferae]
MKKLMMALLFVFLLIALILGLQWGLSVARQQPSSQKGETLTFYNWGDYIDPSILSDFSKETGYKVNYQTFDSNEAMYTKIAQGGTNYDLAVPSDYMVAKLTKAGLLAKLDKSKLTGMDHVNPQFLNQSFERGNQYSVPYFWGTLGILYNKTKVDGSKLQNWSSIWSEQYKKRLLLVDSARDILGLTLISQGKSVNDQNKADLAAAQGKLSSLMPNVKAIVGDELKLYMAQGEADLAVTYSGEAKIAMEQNKDLAYTVPKDGSNLWLDNLVIPKKAAHKKAAYALINYLNRPDVAAKNADYIGYATPNQKAYQLLPKSVKSDKAFYPEQSILDRLQVYENFNQYWTQTYNDAFLEFKLGKS